MKAPAGAGELEMEHMAVMPAMRARSNRCAGPFDFAM